MTSESSGGITLIAELPGHQDRAWAIAWNPTKPLLASCSADKTVRLYSYRAPPASSPEDGSPSEGGEPKFELNASITTGHAKSVRALGWSPSGNTLATGSFDSNVGIWQQVGDEEGEGVWECSSSLEGHETECKGVAYSPSGTLLASCSRDKSVWVWEVLPDADFECMGVLMEHSQDVKSVAWHPREEILASCSYDDTVRIWVDDPQDDWDCVAILRGHTSTVWSISFSPDGNYIASGSDDKTVRIWKRVQKYKWDCVQVLEGHNDRTIFSVAWGEGKPGSLGWVASASSDGQIVVYQANGTEDGGIEVEVLAKTASAHGVYDVNCVGWCPRKGLENYLASCGDDGSVNIWKVGS